MSADHPHKTTSERGFDALGAVPIDIRQMGDIIRARRAAMRTEAGRG